MHAPNLNARRAGVLRSFPLSTFSQCFCHKGVQKLFKDDTKVEHSVPVKAQMCNDEVVCCANTKTKGDWEQSIDVNDDQHISLKEHKLPSWRFRAFGMHWISWSSILSYANLDHEQRHFEDERKPWIPQALDESVPVKALTPKIWLWIQKYPTRSQLYNALLKTQVLKLKQVMGYHQLQINTSKLFIDPSQLPVPSRNHRAAETRDRSACIWGSYPGSTWSSGSLRGATADTWAWTRPPLTGDCWSECRRRQQDLWCPCLLLWLQAQSDFEMDLNLRARKKAFNTRHEGGRCDLRWETSWQGNAYVCSWFAHLQITELFFWGGSSVYSMAAK